jgi:hypothetical protein
MKFNAYFSQIFFLTPLLVLNLLDRIFSSEGVHAMLPDAVHVVIID